MLTIKCRLPLKATRFLAAAGMTKSNDQTRHSSLTMQTLNPLVKEVEYAVRGMRKSSVPSPIDPGYFSFAGPIVIRAGEIEKQLKVTRSSLDVRTVYSAEWWWCPMCTSKAKCRLHSCSEQLRIKGRVESDKITL